MVEHLPDEEDEIAKHEYRSKAKPKDMKRSQSLKITNFFPSSIYYNCMA